MTLSFVVVFCIQCDWIMSRGRSNAGNSNSGYRGLPDYGATSTSGAIMAGPSSSTDVVFSPTEFMSLSENIAQSIGSVRSVGHQLEKAIRSIGGPKDNAAFREKV